MATKYPIDLGRSGGPCCVSSPSEEKYYPSFTIDGDENLGLPKEGTMTIKFKKTGESMNTGRDGKTHYSCHIDILEILDTEGAKAKDEEKSTGDVLDEYIKEKGKKDPEDNTGPAKRIKVEGMEETREGYGDML